MSTASKWRAVFCAMIFAIAVVLGSCSSITGPGYYSHIIIGEAKILAARTPITKLLADKNTPEELKQNLRHVQEIREFAIYELGLPVAESFTTYVDTGRKYATWALTATPEFSIRPRMWYYPIVGYVSYLGFFLTKEGRNA